MLRKIHQALLLTITKNKNMDAKKLKPAAAKKILNTKKAFICFNTQNNIINEYILTDDLIRHKNKFTFFKVISCIKKEFLTIKK